ncbi:recombinase family protein [Mesorhizobium sp.]|uniref:recombinase family protein n=1 Tax=Mesorhizobium sp. TaxID=1871066 RepID=UPI0034318385
MQNEPKAHSIFVRAYLRASTKEQDAGRSRADLEAFASQHGLRSTATYMENESGACLARPEVFRLLGDCQRGDILLTEQVDRLSRLNTADWERLKDEIRRRHVKVIALDLPTSHMMRAAATMILPPACSMPSTECFWICWPRLPARTMTTADAARPRASPRPKAMAATKGRPEDMAAMPALPPPVSPALP